MKNIGYAVSFWRFFRWDEVRRAHLRAELDACYARLYGLTREELSIFSYYHKTRFTPGVPAAVELPPPQYNCGGNIHPK